MPVGNVARNQVTLYRVPSIWKKSYRDFLRLSKIPQWISLNMKIHRPRQETVTLAIISLLPISYHFGTFFCSQWLGPEYSVWLFQTICLPNHLLPSAQLIIYYICWSNSQTSLLCYESRFISSPHLPRISHVSLWVPVPTPWLLCSFFSFFQWGSYCILLWIYSTVILLH